MASLNAIEAAPLTLNKIGCKGIKKV